MRLLSAQLPKSIVLALGTWAGSVNAEPVSGRSSSLGWVRLPGAESCLSAAELSRSVEQFLGRALFVSPSMAQMAVEGRAERLADSSGFRAIVQVTGPSGAVLGSRELTSHDPSCAGLSEPLSLAIALMIDPDAPRPTAGNTPPTYEVPNGKALPRFFAPADARPVDPLVRPSFVPASQTLASPPVTRAPSSEGFLRAGGAWLAGALPHWGPGLALQVGVDLAGLFPLELHAAAWLQQSIEVDAARGAKVSAFLIGVIACPVGLQEGAGHLVFCGGLDAFALAVQGVGFAGGVRSEQRWSPAAVGSARAGYDISRHMSLSLGLGVDVLLQRDSFDYTDTAGAAHPLYRPAVLAPVGDLVLGIRFP